MLEPESPSVESHSMVEIDPELAESVRERVGSWEGVEQWVSEAVESHLGRETDPRPDLSRSEYHRWFTEQAIRVRLRGEPGPDSGIGQSA
jgi:hypothetical protein